MLLCTLALRAQSRSPSLNSADAAKLTALVASTASTTGAASPAAAAAAAAGMPTADASRPATSYVGKARSQSGKAKAKASIAATANGGQTAGVIGPSANSNSNNVPKVGYQP